MFVQDSNGLISTSNTDLTVDTTDAPFRHKLEPPQVARRLSPAGGLGLISASTKIGEYIHRSHATAQVMRKGGQSSPRVASLEYHTSQRANNTIVEESFRGEAVYHNQATRDG